MRKATRDMIGSPWNPPTHGAPFNVQSCPTPRRDHRMTQEPDSLSIVVIGASGHLARTKIFPALFALYCQGYLPERFHLFGFARSELSHAEFRQRVTEHLTCRYVPDHSCGDRMEEFLARTSYVPGDYGSRDSLLDLYAAMRDREGASGANRFYYLAIPPSIFIDAARAIGDAGLVQCDSSGPWSRVVLEKPFGRDRESSDALSRAIAQVFSEDQTFRIDHYLGKEVIQNLMVLRFANLVFEPLWNRDFIHSVKIVWKEDLPLEGRGGYFDQYGIIRDVVQNHLLQILALVAMEPPDVLDASHVAREKVKVLLSVPPLAREDLVIGQYGASIERPGRFPAYVDDPTVADDTITPTFAAARLSIENPRWEGVPFLITAGKGLDARMTEIRIQFRDVPGNMFCTPGGCPEANQFVIRVQPDEAIYLSLVNKVPGLGMTLEPRNLDLRYEEAFDRKIPDAYESLLLDVIQGDKS
ncbi:MAG: glucose-6-phosphate dehydrogenase, partial [Planctomycetes bacterium]|nr:glucose-6-phosphate dehydrogenase [Planctomycetota bacterium]